MLKVKEKVTSFWQNHDLEKFHPYNRQRYTWKSRAGQSANNVDQGGARWKS